MAKKTRPDLFDIVKTCLDGIRMLLEDMDEPGAERVIGMIQDAKRVFVTGKGRSGYIGDCFGMRLMQMGFDAHVVGEATCPRIGKGDLMVAISCSGTTATTLQFARISRDSGAKVVVVTARPDSPLAELAHCLVLVPVTARDVRKQYLYVLGPHNNTLFEDALLLYFDAMVYSMLLREGIPEKDLTLRHTNLQ